jgi:hypothetical protein
MWKGCRVHTYSSVTGLWSDRSSEWVWWKHGGGWGKWGAYRAIRKGCGRASVNGMLHFLFYHFQTVVYDIVAVNGQGNTCKVIPWPDQRECPQVAFISQSQGHLHCISELVKGSDFGFHGLSIWVLEDYDLVEWVLKHSLSF